MNTATKTVSTGVVSILNVLIFASGLAHAQTEPPPPIDQGALTAEELAQAEVTADSTAVDFQTGETSEVPATGTPLSVQPSGSAPMQMPPPPPAQPPALPVEQEQVQQMPAPVPAQPLAQQQDAAGQWVYTPQYGWLWMPYGTQYTYEGAGDNQSQPYSYVYYPTYGWTWLAAPWVWGWGAYPYFGVAGPWNFGWYRGLYHAGYGWGGYRGGFARAYANGYRGGYVSGGGHAIYGGASRGAAPVRAFGGGFTGGTPRFTGGSVGGFTGGSRGGFTGGGHRLGGGHMGGGSRGGRR